MSMPAEHIATAMTLDQLLERLAAAPALPVHDLAIDSRRVRPGAVFLACRGGTRHGLEFADAAVEAGASAVVYDASTAPAALPDCAVPLVPVAHLSEHLGALANRFFDSPSEHIDVVGVTGTNGKSTVSWLLAECLSMLGRPCGYAGTLGYGTKVLIDDSDMTTPDVIELHRRLAGFRDEGALHAAIEVSSHALDQRRVDGVQFDAALFTNLSRDHLDYHGNMRAYGEAKAKLFVEHRAKLRIINLDSEFGSELAARCGNDVITVSTRFDRVANGRPYVFVRSVVVRPGGSQVRLHTSWGDSELFVPMPGEYNVANAAIVLAYLLATGIDIGDASGVIQSISAPPGRMQRVAADGGPVTYVDYAHTPNALESALRALRAHGRGKLWLVFGCGGERDPGKRPLMGRIAERLADVAIVTTDNPRNESPQAIIADVISGMTSADRAIVIEDRAAAIAYATANAAADDRILIAGKGHEDYQIIGNRRLPFSDHDAAKANLDRRVAGERR
ncbi:MAG: UDP-N-acetylmuramoyl-L-alanyl-D-glutamate--2,6-diaminopimelate ligase [Woeseiaceae bacterium]|nr:UDP-N-acetylmuramoyl-L-alanyl-D-glutamate--2,6-diaminopimelate ligase [Woeseiaceae bacterium]